MNNNKMEPLHYLSAYWPYNLQLIDSDGGVHNLFGLEHPNEMLLISQEHNQYGRARIDNRDLKPLLHPLSKLTEEIEHNGERFVPLHEILMWYSKPYWPKNRPVNPIRDWRFKDILKLTEWHFDVFNLIPEGKAIEK